MLSGISITDRPNSPQLNLYRDPGTNKLSLDIDGNTTLQLSKADAQSIIDFLQADTEVLQSSQPAKL